MRCIVQSVSDRLAQREARDAAQRQALQDARKAALQAAAELAAFKLAAKVSE